MFSILSLLIFLLPFCLSSASAAEPYSLSSFFCLVVILAFSVLWIILRRLPVKKFRSIKHPFLLTLLFLVIAIACCPAAQLKSPEEISQNFIGLLLFVIAASLSQEEKNQLTSAIVLSAFCISLMAVFQYFFGFNFLTDYLKEANINDPYVMEKIAQRRVFFPFPEPVILGGYLAMILPLAFNIKWGKFFVIPLAFALLLTRSLGALLSLAIVSAVIFILGDHSKKKKILIPLLLAVIIGFVFHIRMSAPELHLLPTFSVGERLEYWKGAWGIIRAHPWIGTGLGSFDLPGRTYYAHNIFLQFWAEAGIASVFFFFWLVAAILRNGWENLQRLPEKKRQIGLFAGACVFLIHNLVDFTFFLPAVSLIWWVMMGLLFSPNEQKEK
ncbi:MAG: O-antigen ligase family protein [Candidatus Omnitrophota bacterium]